MLLCTYIAATAGDDEDDDVEWLGLAGVGAERMSVDVVVTVLFGTKSSRGIDDARRVD